MKSHCKIASGLLLAGVLSSFLLPVSAKTEPKMAATKMSSTKMSSSKMSSSKMSSSKVTQMSGTILSMTATSLTVKPLLKSMGASKTVSIPASAKIMMGAVPTKLSGLKAGEKVTVMMKGGVVDSVRVVAANKTVSGKTMKTKTTKMSSAKKM